MKSTDPIGVMAVKLGYATPDQVQSALYEQQSRISRDGKNSLIGLIMGEMGILTSEQLMSILNQYDDNSIPVSDDAIRLASRFHASFTEEEKMIVFLSGYGLEGNTTIISQISLVMSLMNDGKVLVVDANLRTPSLNKLFNIDQIPGLSDVLSSNCTIDEAISSTDIHNLSILPSGDVVVNFMSLLLSEKCDAIFKQLRSRYRYILVDAPPILQTPEALVIAGYADGAVMVVSSGFRSKQDVYEMKRILGSVGTRILGVILSEHEKRKSNFNIRTLFNKLVNKKTRSNEELKQRA